MGVAGAELAGPEADSERKGGGGRAEEENVSDDCGDGEAELAAIEVDVEGNGARGRAEGRKDARDIEWNGSSERDEKGRDDRDRRGDKEGNVASGAGTIVGWTGARD